VVLADTQRPPTRALGLKGVHQHDNAWVALAALNQLPSSFGPVAEGWPASFENAYVAGRFDVRGRWIFDVAHNPDGMQVLVATLRAFAPARPLHALVGIRNDKEWREMLALLAPTVDRLILTVAPSVAPDRRWLLEEVAQWSRARPDGSDKPDVVWEPDFARALNVVQEGAQTMLVTGSFHTVGDALARL
jgi:dihydrofolate synthase/folylpolyglutamate synthase